MISKKVTMSKKGYVRYICFLGSLLVVFSLFTLEHKFVVVSGDSMLPTLSDRDIIISSKVNTVTPGNIYLIREPDSEQYAIKRLIGIPGDTIELIEGATYRNGEKIMDAMEESWYNSAWDLGADEYLFIGDNRGVSYDGRYWSRHITRSEILYQLDFRIFPLTSIGKVV